MFVPSERFVIREILLAHASRHEPEEITAERAGDH